MKDRILTWYKSYTERVCDEYGDFWEYEREFEWEWRHCQRHLDTYFEYVEYRFTGWHQSLAGWIHLKVTNVLRHWYTWEDLML